MSNILGESFSDALLSFMGTTLIEIRVAKSIDSYLEILLSFNYY